MKPSAKNRRFSMSQISSNISAQFRTALCASNIPSSCWSNRNINKVQVKDSWIILMFHGSETSWTLSDIVPTHCWLSPLPNQCLETPTRVTNNVCLPTKKHWSIYYTGHIITSFSLEVLTFKFHGHLRDPITPMPPFFLAQQKALTKA